MILVTGGTGTVGKEVVQQLLAAGEKVRVMTRDPAKAKFDAKVEVVTGDLEKPETLSAAVAGVAGVFALSTGPQVGMHDGNIAAAAKKAGAKKLVKLSVLAADAPGGLSAVASWHAAGEEAVRESGLEWTFVRPGGFMSNALNWAGSVKGAGKVFSNFGEGKTPPIHPRDIAAVAVTALTKAGHAGKAYPLTGGESLTVGEQVKILSEAVGKPIQYVPISDEQAREGMLKAGLPAALVDSLVTMAGFVRSGKAGEVLPTVEQVLGRKPLTFAEWAKEHAAAFR